MRVVIVFRTASHLAAALSLACVVNAWAIYSLSFAGSLIPETRAAGFGIVGALGAASVFIALVGPLRVGFSDAMIPLQIKAMLRVLGPSLLVGGGSAVALSWIGNSLIQVLLSLVMAAAAGICSWAGFFRLSRQLPAGLTAPEMLTIIKSANLFGSKKESVVDGEYRRWTGGKSEGISVRSPAVDGVVYSLAGEESKLSEFWTGDAPLVINFGSYSCPIHRKRLEELKGLVAKWEGRGLRFLTVYTAEAHPEDGWRLEGQYKSDAECQGNEGDFCFLQPTTLAERLKMAKWFVEKKAWQMPMVVDSMENTLLSAYNTWPIRFYVIQGGRIVYEGEQGPFGYSVPHLDEFLQSFCPG